MLIMFYTPCALTSHSDIAQQAIYCFNCLLKSHYSTVQHLEHFVCFLMTFVHISVHMRI